MTAPYKIDTSTGTVHVRFTGTIDAQTLLTMFRRYLDDPDSGPGQSCLVDLSEVTTFDLDFRAISILVGRMQGLFAPQDGADLRHSLYAPTDIGFGTGRMYQSISSDVLPARVGVFRDLESARAFLHGACVSA